VTSPPGGHGGWAGPQVSPNVVRQHLESDYHVASSKVQQVRRYRLGGFLVRFQDRQVAEQPEGSELGFSFQRWRRQFGARFASLRYKALLTVDNLPAQALSVDIVQAVIDSSCYRSNQSRIWTSSRARSAVSFPNRWSRSSTESPYCSCALLKSSTVL
jgi:hypothetical protein